MKTRPRPRTRIFALVAFSICFSPFVRGQDTTVVFTGPPEAMTAGSRASIWLNVLNQSDREVSWTFPAKLDCRLVSSHPVLESALDLRRPIEAGQVEIGPGAFARKEYLLAVPASMTGQVVVEFPRLLGANRVVLNLRAPTTADGEEVKKKAALAKLIQEAELEEPGQAYDPGRFFKEHISGYEPFYFLAGAKAPGAKFQISFEYQLVNSHGWLAEHAPALKGFHIAYTQTSLWDWKGHSAPFYDTSYKPELLYSWNRVAGGQPTNWFRIDLQGGLQHESNGKGGADSRSSNIAYLRPTLVVGKDRGQDHGLRLTLQPRAWVYVGNLAENPNLPDYRGHADLRAILGWKRGLQLSALGRMGDNGHHKSLQFGLTYPLMRLISNSFTMYLQMEYFTGYGESFLRYSERGTSFRTGLALYR